jgi:uncharacterized membrane protein YhaH (DUF805 family)
MIVDCPNCEWSDTVDDELAGREAECPDCGSEFTVTAKPVKKKLSVARKNVGANNQQAAPAAPNPYSAPKAYSPRRAPKSTSKTYGGIGRAQYFGFSFLNVIVGGILNVVIFPVGSLIIIPVGLYIIVNRLKNVGYSGWLCLLIFVPLVNLWFWFICIVAPEGYADHKKLDTAGKIIVCVFLGIFALAVLVGVLAK